MKRSIVVFALALLFPLLGYAQTQSCVSISKNIGFGSRGTDVVQLQIFLIAQGSLASGNNTGYFGKLTQAAVQQWQKKNGVVSSGTPATTGYGSVGPKTRAAIAKVCATAASQSSASGSSQSGGSYTLPPGNTTISNTIKTEIPIGIPGNQSCTFNGQTISSGSSVTAYQSASVSAGSSCQSQTRTCTNGTLSGSYTNASCTVGTSVSCTWNGQSVANGASVTAYQSSSVSAGSQCVSETRTCANGTLSGSYTNASCAVGTPTSCTFNGQTVANGSSVTAYQSSSVSTGSYCVSETRSCANGTLSGTYTNASCTVGTPTSCTFNGQNISSGSSVTAYQSSSVSTGSSCVSETRSCSNGTLSGSYQSSSCTVTSESSINTGYSLPLKVSGRYIVDAGGQRVRLKSMNWDGFNEKDMIAQGLDKQSLDIIFKVLADAGFNSIRLMYANEMLRAASMVPDARVNKNPDFKGKTPYAAFKLFVQKATDYGFFVVIDNHQTKAGEFGTDPGDGLWFGPSFSEEQWLQDWQLLADDFKGNKRVVGYELRNEIHDATWGGQTVSANWCHWGQYDWRLASIRAIQKLRAIDPDAITFVEALNWAIDLRGPWYCQITSNDLGGIIPNVAYSVHVYGWHEYDSGAGAIHALSESAQRDTYGRYFGYAIAQNQPYTVPVWVSEFGTRSELGESETYRTHFVQFVDYLQSGLMDYAYYSIGRFYPKDSGRASGFDCAANTGMLRGSANDIAAYESKCETYGLLNADWSAIEKDWRSQVLSKILQ